MLPLKKVHGIVCHWIGHASSHDFIGEAGMARIREMHLARGWPEVGYHYGIDRNGNELAGRLDRYRGAHCVPLNATHLGLIFLYGSRDRVLTEASASRAIRTFRELSEFYEFPINQQTILGHRKGDPDYYTECPGPFILDALPGLIKAARKLDIPEGEDPGAERLNIFKTHFHDGRLSVAHKGVVVPSLNMKLFGHSGRVGWVLDGKTVEPSWWAFQGGYK